MYFDTAFDNIRELFLAYKECNFKVKLLVGVGSVNIAEILRDIFIEDKSADSGIYNL